MNESFDIEASLVDIERREAGFRVVDSAGSTLTLTTRGWTRTASEHDFPEHVDERVSGRTRELRLPATRAELRPLDGDVDLGEGAAPGFTGGYVIGEQESFDLPDASYLLHLVGRDIYTFVRFDAPATIRNHGHPTLSFSQPTPVTIGFRSLLRVPRNRITVPKSPAGIATALTHMSAAHRTDSPDRSYITLRAHPPLVSFSDEGIEEIPTDVKRHTPETGIEVRTPETLDTLFAVAPLAYYVGARVVAEDRSDAVIRVPDHDVEYVLAEPVDLAAGRLLRRVFGMDSLVRNAGPYGAELKELNALSDVPFEIDDWYDASPAARFARYLEPDVAPLDAVWPRWQHVVTVDPTMEAARMLPTFLDTLAWLKLPETDDDIETAPFPATGSFNADSRGYEVKPIATQHRFEFVTSQRDQKHLTIVCPEDRREAVTEPLTDATWRAKPPAITIHTDVTVAELQDVAESRTDLFYFVGSWDDGFVCSDGVLSTDGLAIDARACLLDAPGASEACPTLVDQGAVAALGRVSDAAPAVGETLVHAIAEGFIYAQALAFTDEEDTYRLVGDGADSIDPTPLVLSEIRESPDDSGFQVVGYGVYPNPGGVYNRTDDRLQLVGNSAWHDLPISELDELLEVAKQPIRYDGQLFWPGEQDRLLYPFA